MPAIADLAYNISISSLESWDELIEWYTTLIREQDHVTDEIERKTKALIAGAWTRKEKIRRLYEYVAGDIDYVGIELGIWAIKPHSAPQILEKGYGDCKDKSTLLSTMLSVAGVKSYPVLISAGESRQVIREIPSLAYFNHMILAVEENRDGDLMWLDATAETCAFGDLPASDQDRWTLIVNPDYSVGETTPTEQRMHGRLFQFTKTPMIPAESNLKRVVTRLEVEADLAVKTTQEITLTGEFNTRLRAKLRYTPPDDRSKFLHEYMELDDRAKLDEFEISDLDGMEDTLKISLTWRCADYIFAIGRQYVLELPIAKHPYAALLSEEGRTHPVALGKTVVFEDEVSVNLPAGFVIDVVPEDLKIENDVGAVQFQYTGSKRKMATRQVVRFDMPTVGLEAIDSLKTLVRQASNKGATRVTLTRK